MYILHSSTVCFVSSLRDKWLGLTWMLSLLWPWKDSNRNFLQFCDSWATTSHLTLPQKPEQVLSLVLLYSLDSSKQAEWFLIFTQTFLVTRCFLLCTYLKAEVLLQIDVAFYSAPIPQLTADSSQSSPPSF